MVRGGKAMTTIIAESVEINIEEGNWKLYNQDGANSLSPFFYAVRGQRLLNYVVKFGQERGLPGTVLSADYVRSVIVGYDEKRQRWLLGIHVLLNEQDKPRFVEMVRWPAADNPQFGTDCHRAGRILAEYVGCPLKLFGSKLPVPQQPEGKTPRGVTGPLEVRNRTNVDPQRVRIRAESLPMPKGQITAENAMFNKTRSGYTLKLPKGLDEGAHSQVVIDRDSQTVRLLPQTGLLGSLLGSSGRTIKFQDIRYVELRLSAIAESSAQKDDDGLAVDVTKTKQLFGAYLILNDEEVLLVQLEHMATSELTRHRAKTKTLIDGDYDAEKEMAYLRQHLSEQKHHDQIAEFVETVAFATAATANKPLVKSEVGEEMAF
jgi:hypothetical protein